MARAVSRRLSASSRSTTCTATAWVGEQVAVIGGGNSAIDAARTALRLGAKKVTILYRRQRAQMPAWARRSTPPTSRASRSCRWSRPKEIVRDAAGKVTGVLCQQMVLGDYDRSGRRRPVAGRNPDFIVACDQVIAAIGQSLDADRHARRLFRSRCATAGSRPIGPTGATSRRLGLRRRRRRDRSRIGGGGHRRRREGRGRDRRTAERCQPCVLAPRRGGRLLLRSRRRSLQYPERRSSAVSTPACGPAASTRSSCPGIWMSRWQRPSVPALRLRQGPGPR